MQDITKYINETLKEHNQVTIQSGEYCFTQLILSSNSTIILESGATLKAVGFKEDYKFSGYNHNEFGDVYSNIYALDSENISIKGDGILDLDGDRFFDLDIPSVVNTVGPIITQQHLDEAPRTFIWRINQPIFFHNCKNINIEGITIKNSPSWTLSFAECEKITVHNIKIDNSLIIPNNDGIHFSSSRDMIVSDCHITAGDDCIAFSGIVNWNRPCEDATVSNCIFKSASKAISIGYMHSIVKNIMISNIIIRESNRCYVSMTNPGTGLVENITVSNCYFEGRAYGGNWWGNGEAIVLMNTEHDNTNYRNPKPEPRFKTSMNNINFSNIICQAPRPNAVVSKEGAITDITFSNVSYKKIPDVLESLKGNVIDLAPGPVNYEVVGDETLVIENADVIEK